MNEETKGKLITERGFNRLKQTRLGLMLYNKNDYYIGRSLEHYGEFSYKEIELFKQYIRPGDFVIDAGANIGAHTLYFAQAVAPSGVVFAFEPQRIIFQTLCANMALNCVTNAACFPMALGAQACSASIPPINYNSEDNFGGVSLGDHETGEYVDVATIDEYELPSCSFIKIDVEGMEEAVLRGGEKTIRKYKPFIYVECDREEKAGALIKYLRSLGYRLYWHCPPMFNPENYYGDQKNIFDNVASINMLCIHKDHADIACNLDEVITTIA